MQIRCPECGFERTLDPSQVPASAVMATCPQCRCRFRFRDADTLPDGPAPDAAPTRRARPPLVAGMDDPDESTARAVSGDRASAHADGDDPLPPGAITASSRRMAGQDEGSDKAGENAERTPRPEAKPEGAPSGAPAGRHAPDRERPRADPDRDIRSLFTGGGPSEIPWETAPLSGMAVALYQTMLRALFSAPSFFTSVGASRATLIRPCLFYVAIGVFQGIVEHFWFLSRLNELASMQDAKVQAGISALSQGMNLPMLIVIMPPLLVLQLFIYAGLFTLMVRLVQPDRADFATTLRVVAYSAAPGVLCVVPGVGTFAAAIWFAVCCFIGCKHALNLSWNRTAMAILPLYILSVAISLHVGRMLAGMLGS